MNYSDNIDEILDLLKIYWHKHPYLRLGQIICNLTTKNRSISNDPFYCHDNVIKEELKKLLYDREDTK